MKLGTRQLEMLQRLASPTLFLIVPDKVTASLERLGLVKGRGAKRDDDRQRGFVQITPKGMRTVADLWEAGTIKFDLPKPKRKKAPKRAST